MTSGDLCVAAPARPVTCEEKVYPGVVWRRAQPRCLFGPPDPVETEKLLQEQTRIELERFQRRWDVDLELLEAAIQERLQPSPSQDKPVANPGSILRPTVDRPKRLQPGGLKRQTYLTGIAPKSVASLELAYEQLRAIVHSDMVQSKEPHPVFVVGR
ncbi:hypothetical protein J6590_052088 [Homalodisca vitripennis]|nr:hypothetical protein J6590_052088 [Homalodisca vitripennis]